MTTAARKPRTPKPAGVDATRPDSNPRPDQTTTPAPKTGAYKTVIVAHHERAQWARELAYTLGATISMDDGRLGCFKNHAAAWRHHEQHTTTEWALVVEDDALPIPDCTRQISLALGSAPVGIVSLYLGRQRPPQYQAAIAAAIADAETHDHAYLTAARVFHAVGIAIRTNLIPSMLRFINHNPYCHLDTDEALTEWIRYYGHLIAYTQPSLLDHRDSESIARHRDSAPREPGRVAHKLGARDTWETPYTRIGTA